MPLLSWLPTFPRSSVSQDVSPDEDTAPADPSQSYRALDPDALVNQVERLQQELAYAHGLCEQANLQFAKYRVEIADLRAALSDESAKIKNLQGLLAHERATIHVLGATSDYNKNEIKRHKLLVGQLQTKLASEAASLHAVTRHARDLERLYVDAKFDLEYSKCTTGSENVADASLPRDADAPLPAQPFVVVLVDGDAYTWASDLFIKTPPAKEGFPGTYADQNYPGAIAATRIRTEVIKYILNQKRAIPSTSKIITRVFCNFGADPNHYRARAVQGDDCRKTFAVQFTEKIPLFDYFDAGRGKERADDKIRENFHLYLSTPNCHAIFLAACYDNGFARMLEQYSDHAVAREKIVLVTARYVAPEIQRLNLCQVTWPSVFAERAMPKPEASKVERAMRKRLTRSLLSQRRPPLCFSRAEQEEHLRHTRLLLDVVSRWDINQTARLLSQGMGVESPKGGKIAQATSPLPPLAHDDSTVD